MQHSQQHLEKCVFRSFALPVTTFDYLKQFQRDYQARYGVWINNNEAITIILRQHQQQTNDINEDSGEQNAEDRMAQGA